MTSPEFFSRAAFRAKVKTPFELVVSARRALASAPDTTPTTARLVGQLGQPIFGRLTPDGWPDAGGAWINSGTIYQRIRFGYDTAEGRAQLAPVERWHGWATLSTQPLNRQVDGVLTNMLGGVAEPKTREVRTAEIAGVDRDRLRVTGVPAAISGSAQRRVVIGVQHGKRRVLQRFVVAGDAVPEKRVHLVRDCVPISLRGLDQRYFCCQLQHLVS